MVEKVIKKTTTTTVTEEVLGDVSTYVGFLLDETGSMGNVRDEVISGYNKYISDLTGDIFFTATKFDSSGERTHCASKRPGDIPPLSRESYRPGAATPLIDATYNMIKRIEAFSPERAQIVIFTDGYENSSREHTLSELKEIIQHKKSLGWDFIFLGADIDAFGEAGKMGVLAQSTLSFDKKKLTETFGVLRNSTVAYASTGNVTSYSDSDRQRVKDYPGSSDIKTSGS